MIYNLILVLILPVVVPGFLIFAIFKSRFRAGFWERLGFWRFSSIKLSISEKPFPTLWIHAASVGEVEAMWPLFCRLVKQFPSACFVLTTLTVTGRTLLQQRLQRECKGRPGIIIRLFPVDLPGLALQLFEKLRPDLILITETELWPNFLTSARRKGIPVVMVNGRISARAFVRYRFIRWILRPTLLGIDQFLMQSRNDADRMIKLGALPDRVFITGNLKFEQHIERLSQFEREFYRRSCGWNASDPIWASGSTHPKEEEEVLDVFRVLKKDFPELRLILAPRHLERISEVTELLSRSEFTFKHLSDFQPSEMSSEHFSDPPTTVDILLVDRMGLLRRLYDLADIVFVGGSLSSTGGHNLAEPALLEKPVIFGSHIQQVKGMADLLLSKGGGIQVVDRLGLERNLRRLFSDSELCKSTGRLARLAILKEKGAVQLTMQRISTLFDNLTFNAIPKFDQRNKIHRWIEDDLWSSREGGKTRLCASTLGGVSSIYNGLQHVRKIGYQTGIFRSRKLTRPVISVGNIMVGGSGKTPAVISICNVLLNEGLRPAVLSRGYGGENHSAVLEVSDGKQIKWPANIVGDEPVLMAQKLPGIPIFVGSDRVKVGQAAIHAHHPDVLVLDDGFQHRRLSRNLDIVLIHTSDPFGNGYVLPRGPLREPISHLGRANVFVLTHVEAAESCQGLIRFLQDCFPKIPLLLSQHQTSACVHLFDEDAKSVASLKDFPEKDVFIVLGIGNPKPFIRSVIDSGLNVVGYWIFPDHGKFQQDDISSIEKKANQLGSKAILTTRKDAIRLRVLGWPLKGWWAVDLELSMYEPEIWKEVILKGL